VIAIMSIPARRPVGSGRRPSYTQGADWQDSVSSTSADEYMRPVDTSTQGNSLSPTRAEMDSYRPAAANSGPYKSVAQTETWADEPSLKGYPDNAFRPPRNSSAFRKEGVETPKNPVTFYVVAADTASVLLPLALLGFLIVVILLHGKETSNGSFAKWENAITVVHTPSAYW
jgi:hypothetical protein